MNFKIMKNLKEYLISEKNVTGDGCIQMIQSIITELSSTHSDCKYDQEKNKWIGKDADLWNGAGQFLYEYTNSLNQSDLKKIVDHFGWKKWIPDINDINPAEISMCISLELNKY